MNNTVKDSAIKKLKLLITVVDRPKGEFYLDVLGQYHKAVILSVVREDLVEEIMNCLEDKFHSVRGGKGICFAVPLSSVIGVNLYQFLSDNRMGREG